MRTLLALLFFAAFSCAQENSALAHSFAACGPLDVHFDAQGSTSGPIAQPEAGKSLVYVVQDFKRAPGEWGDPTIRVGVDGVWAGAVRASTYLSFPVDPGEHHLCTSWQSRLERLSHLAAFARLNAEPGKTYYFRARVTYSSSGNGAANMGLDLEAVDPDEGQYLIASGRVSNSHPKK